MYKNLLNDRQENFDSYKSEACLRMMKLSSIYEKADGSGRKTNKLKDWFLARHEQMSHLTLSGNNIRTDKKIRLFFAHGFW